jgi:hypothetical protein
MEIVLEHSASPEPVKNGLTRLGIPGTAGKPKDLFKSVYDVLRTLSRTHRVPKDFPKTLKRNLASPRHAVYNVFMSSLEIWPLQGVPFTTLLWPLVTRHAAIEQQTTHPYHHRGLIQRGLRGPESGKEFA